MKIREVLKKGVINLTKQKNEDALLKARMLLMYELGLKSEILAMHMDEEIELQIAQKFECHIQELMTGKPIQYITNSQEFYGLEFYVDENVLIPQPDTEILVEEVIEICKSRPKTTRILDICTGSGAIAIVLNKKTEANITASDVSPKALEVAKKNASKHQAKIEFVESDMFERLSGKFDMIVSNPPYIETKTIENLSKEVKNEPILALDGGKDGLDFYRILAKQAKSYLEKDGILAVEIGYNQKKEVMEIFEKHGFCDIYAKKDFGNQDRIVIGKWR